MWALLQPPAWISRNLWTVGFSSFFIKISAVEIQVLIEAKCGCRCNRCVLIDLFIVMRVLYCL